MTNVAYELNDLWEIGNTFLPDVSTDYERAQQHLRNAIELAERAFAGETLGTPGMPWRKTAAQVDDLLGTGAQIMAEAAEAVRETARTYAADEEYASAQVHLVDDLIQGID